MTVPVYNNVRLALSLGMTLALRDIMVCYRHPQLYFYLSRLIQGPVCRVLTRIPKNPSHKANYKLAIPKHATGSCNCDLQ